MKKTNKALSILLTLCMVLSLLPAMGLTASADGVTARTTGLNLQPYDSETEYGIDSTHLPTNVTYNGGVYTGTNENWSWNEITKTLTLSGATITTKTDIYGAAVYLPTGSKIVLAEDTVNTLAGTDAEYGLNPGIYCAGDVEITGNGTLDVTGGSGDNSGSLSGPYGSFAIVATGELKISGGTVNATAIAAKGANSDSIGVQAGSLTVDGGSLIAKGAAKNGGGTSAGVKTTDGDVTVNSGGLTASGNDKAIYGTLTTTGTVKAGANNTGTDDAYSGQLWVNVSFAPIFADGFGTAGLSFYNPGTIGTGKGYTFDGWYNNGTKLAAAANAMEGKTYTAKWTKNGKTVITTPLDFTGTSPTLPEGCGITWNNNTLTLDGAIIDTTGGNGNATAAIKLPAGAKIVVSGDSTVVSGLDTTNHSYAVACSGALDISGSGRLTVTAANAPSGHSMGLYTTGDITISGVTLEVSSGTAAGFSHGIWAAGGSGSTCNVTVTSGSVTVRGNDKAFYSNDPTTGAATVVKKTAYDGTGDDAANYDAAKYVSISFGPSATVADVTVSGTEKAALESDATVTITLANDTFANFASSGWITNLPAGLTQSVAKTTDTTATITISGTPTAASGSAMAITIPKEALTTNKSKDVTVTANANAKFAIAPAAPAEGVGYTIDYAAETISTDGDYEIGVTEHIFSTDSPIFMPGHTYRVRKAASGDLPASAPTEFTVASRPTKPDALTSSIVGSKTDTKIVLTGTLATNEYKVGDKAWQTGGSDLTFTELTADTPYNIVTRVKATNSKPRSENSDALSVTTKKASASVTPPSVPTIGSGANAPTANGITITPVVGNEYYISTSENADWSGTPNGYFKAENTNPHTFTGLDAKTRYYIHVRTAETDTAMPSASAKASQYTAYATPTSGAYQLNAADNTVTFGSDYEVNTASAFNGTTISSGDPLNPGTTYYIRHKSGTGTGGDPIPASAPLAFTCASAAVSDISIDATKNGAITPVTGVTVTLNGDTFNDTVVDGTTFDTNVDGIIATVTAVDSERKIATVAISGTPTAVIDGKLTITIPATALTNGAAITSAESSGATVKIASDAVYTRADTADFTAASPATISYKDIYGNTKEGDLTGDITDSGEGWKWFGTESVPYDNAAPITEANHPAKTLVLDGANIDVPLSQNNNGLTLPAGTTVLVIGDNKVSSGSFSGIYIRDTGDITFEGGGALTVVGANTGISSGSDLNFNGSGKVAVTGNTGNGVFSGGQVSVSGGTLTAEGGSTAIKSGDDIVYDGLFLHTPVGGVVGDDRDDSGYKVILPEANAAAPAKKALIGPKPTLSFVGGFGAHYTKDSMLDYFSFDGDGWRVQPDGDDFTVIFKNSDGDDVTPAGARVGNIFQDTTDETKFTAMVIADIGGMAVGEYTIELSCRGVLATTTLTIDRVPVKDEEVEEASTITVKTNNSKGGTVSGLGDNTVPIGGKLTIKIKPNTGYVIDDVLIDGVSVGAVDSYTFRNVKGDHDVQVKFRQVLSLDSLAAGELEVLDFYDVAFKDVNIPDWFYDYVMDLAHGGVINGYPDGTYKPGENVTWGEALTLIMKATGYPTALAEEGQHWASGNT